jgi:hypothetical protein
MIVGDFRTPPSPIVRSSRPKKKKINKNPSELNDT